MATTINTQNNGTSKPVQSVQQLNKDLKPAADQTPINRSVEVTLTEKSAFESKISQLQQEQQTKKEKSTQPSLDEAVKQLDDYVQSIQRNLKIYTDTDSGRTVVNVYDTQTEKLVRQIPNEETLIIARQIKERGLSIDAGKQEQGLFLKIQA